MDGNYFIASRITELNSIDASWFLHSPLPSGLLELVANEVKRLRTQAVEPVFVFNGLPVHGDVESFVNTPDELRLREEIWAELNVGSYVTREVIERAFDIVLGEDVEMALMRYMSQKLSVEVYRAPFLHWGEMVAMQQGKPYYADEVFGPVEMLAMDNITRVITHVDSRKASFNYINKDDVLQSLFPRVRDKKSFCESVHGPGAHYGHSPFPLAAAACAPVRLYGEGVLMVVPGCRTEDESNRRC